MERWGWAILENVLFYLMEIPVYSYGFMIGVGLLFGALLAMREAKRRGIGSPRMFDFIVKVSFSFLVAGKVSALFEVYGFGFLLRPWALITSLTIDEVVGLWGALAFGLYYIMRHSAFPLIFVDSIAPSIALVQSFAHLGSNIFGRSSSGPWAVTFGQFELHPTQLYAAIGYYTIFSLLWRTRKSTRFDGQLFLGLLALGAWLRWILKFWQEAGGETYSPWFTFGLAVVFTILWMFMFTNSPLSAYKKRKGSISPLVGAILTYLGVVVLMILFFYWRFS